MRTIAWVTLLAINVVLAFAAVGKLLDISEFMRVLRGWEMLAPEMVPLVALVVPTLELGLALRWLLGVGRMQSIIATTVLIGVYTCAYAYELFVAKSPPACGCLGLWEHHAQEVSSGRYVMFRNLTMMIALSCAGLVTSSNEQASRSA